MSNSRLEMPTPAARLLAGDAAATRRALDGGASVNAVNVLGLTPLMEAIQAARLAVVPLLAVLRSS